MISKADRGSSVSADLRSGPLSQEHGSEGSGARDGLVERLAALCPRQDDDVADALRAALRRRIVEPSEA